MCMSSTPPPIPSTPATCSSAFLVMPLSTTTPWASLWGRSVNVGFFYSSSSHMQLSRHAVLMALGCARQISSPQLSDPLQCCRPIYIAVVMACLFHCLMLPGHVLQVVSNAGQELMVVRSEEGGVVERGSIVDVAVYSR